MVGDKICLRLINFKTHETKLISKSLNNIEHVEQLVHSVLENEGIRPVCRNLFGLKLISDNVWLAPNEPISSLIKWNTEKGLDGESDLEIRIRFRPSCPMRVFLLDPIAFEAIFSQINHDFMKTRFNDEKRDFVLLNDSVLGLVALNLVRYSVEQKVSVEEVLKRVKPKDFIPRRAARWQQLCLFPFAKIIKLEESLKIGFQQCDNDTRKIKQRFIELFLQNVAPDYNSELYEVDEMRNQDEQPPETEAMQLRVRYKQSQGDASCSIELRKKPITNIKNGNEKRGDEIPDKWVEICNIATISRATMCDNQVQIASSGGKSYRFKFNSKWHAKSFLSCVDGYHRLMIKWNFSLCRDVSSPELKQLTDLGCHGPIGLETTRIKLLDYKRKDCYLIRKCMINSNTFLIDTFCDRALLTIDVDWCPEERLYRKTGRITTSLRGLDVVVETGKEGYSMLKALINDMIVRIVYQPDENVPPKERVHQLKFMIHPKEGDINPALMLSSSMNNLIRQEGPEQALTFETTKHLPVVIPRTSLMLDVTLPPVTNNGLKTDRGRLAGNQQVIVKSYQQLPLGAMMEEYTFHYCPGGNCNSELEYCMKSSQMRMSEWLFVRSNSFANSIGFVMPGALVQEFLPLGTLDKYLRDNNREVSFSDKLSISLQIAEALLFLNDHQIIHGKIRAHNIMVSQSSPILVKLTDPLGAMDTYQDQAFIPNEYYNSNIQVCVGRFYTGIDIWATGTTMWQIFNDEVDVPPGRYANTLTQLNIPDVIWNLIEGCWIVEPNFRTSPQILHRDLFDLLAWKDSSHCYSYVRPSDLRITRPPTTNSSSNNDLSTLNNSDSFLLNSPNSSHTSNSRAGLLRARASGTHDNQASGSELAQNPISSLYNGTMKTRNWMNWGIWSRSGNLGLPNYSSSALDSPCPNNATLDSVSLASSTLSGSELTGTTDILETRSFSEALDRCIWLVDSSRLKLGTEIGRGSSGVVTRGVMSRKEGGEEVVAVKCIERDSQHANDLKREFDILKNLKHKNIIEVRGYVDESRMMLIFEYMPRGSLLSSIRKFPSPDDLAKLPLRKYANDIAQGMEYLENQKIVHRDLALRNILMNNREEVKICDFGLAQYLGADGECKLETEQALPLKWYAPETLKNWTFTHKSDVWSYGVVLWEMYSGGDNPHYSGTYENLSETLKHERLPLPLGCPKHMYDLMLACWEYNPDDRKSFAEILEMLALNHGDSSD